LVTVNYFAALLAGHEKRMKEISGVVISRQTATARVSLFLQGAAFLPRCQPRRFGTRSPSLFSASRFVGAVPA
jgi:hypothetical protein